MTLFGVISGVVLTLTLIAVAWQARSTAIQARATSAAAGATALRASLTHLQSVLQLWVDRPELYPYFSEPLPAPTTDPGRTRVRLAAEMWADCVAASLDATMDVETFRRHREDWLSYATTMLSNSLVLHRLVTDNPDWWPELAKVAEQVPEPTPIDGGIR